MENKELKQSKRKLQPGEKFLLGGSLLAFILLAAVGFIRGAKPTYEADMATPETSCKSLVKAMRNQDATQIKHLTTTHGYSVLEKHLKNTRFNSYPKLANRIIAEWGKSIFWEEDPLMEKGREETGFAGRSRSVKQGEKEPVINFKKTQTGWKLDDYMPGPDRLIKHHSRLGYTWNLN